jgi:hypothetical protein
MALQSSAAVVALMLCASCGRTPTAGALLPGEKEAPGPQDPPVTLKLELVDRPSLEFRADLGLAASAREGVWVNARLAPSDGANWGEIDVEMWDASTGTPLQSACFSYVAKALQDDYVILWPGTTVSRILRLGDCYHVGDQKSARIRTLYQDKTLLAAPGRNAPPLFQRLVVSNTVEISPGRGRGSSLETSE